MKLLLFLNDFFAVPLLLVAVAGGGILLFFTVRGAPFVRCGIWFSRIFGEKKQSTCGKNPFRAMTVALAGTLGVGNIVGVATAVHLGGAGALFWMWVSALFAAMLKYGETVLAVSFGGTPMRYMREGLGARRAATAFAAICLVSSLLLGNCLQTQAVTETVEVVCGISPLVTAAIFAGVVLLIVVGGVRRISDVTVRLIPLLSLVFLLGCVGILWQYRTRLPAVFLQIFREAFSLRSAGGGTLGFLLFRGLRYGTLRGLLSNEAGCGTAPMAHATAEGTRPAEQGFWGILEVAIDTLLLCTASGLVFLLFPELVAKFDGMTLAILSFRNGYGAVADYVLAISITLFALASVIAWSYYGISALSYFTKAPWVKTAYLLLYGTICATAPLLPSALLWEITDLGIAAMTVLNTACVIQLRGRIRAETVRYLTS